MNEVPDWRADETEANVLRVIGTLLPFISPEISDEMWWERIVPTIAREAFRQVLVTIFEAQGIPLPPEYASAWAGEPPPWLGMGRK